ncbi:MAG: hypothetical protein HWE24_11285 [Oceanospirillaceae bacterium]|nr:hypothetical protein [Oceanospirillaceae bacterium]
MSEEESTTSARQPRKYRQKSSQSNAERAEVQSEAGSKRFYKIKRKIAHVYFIQPDWVKCPLSFAVWLPFGFSAPIVILSHLQIESELAPFVLGLGFGALILIGVGKVEKYVEGKLLRHEPLARFVWGYHLLALTSSVISFALL